MTWLAATPRELGGLAALLVGASVLSAVVWWQAAQRPTELPAAASVGAVVSASAGTSAQPDPAPPAADASPSAGHVTTHVSGAVLRPGLVRLPSGARVGDAVLASGGATALADLDRVNLARPVVDGEQVHVPAHGESAGAGGAVAGPAGVTPDGRIDLNHATIEQLQGLPGIGPVKAAAIVAHRERQGPFATPGALRAVPGIGERTFQQLADLVTVG